MLKSLRFLPLCLLVFSGYALADDYGNPSSDSYASKRAAVQAAASGVDDLLSDLKSGVNGIRVSKSKSDADSFSYVKVVRNEIQNQLGDSLKLYKGMTCSIRVGLLRDGTIIYAVDFSGDSNLCNTVMSAVRSIKKFPSPPSEQIYQDVKDFTLHLKL
ncbi:cell envelope integrity protein TolA [Salmonella enterica]|nr:cell envelope integrity protein TolA [Salmonella enterica]ECH1663037.1 cell envelope integrity protein TolA [Salmonella enterica]ECO8796807.1 cell envelope integrity protein TolA [Salmonella enterica]EKE8131729.1 cell envelope integrity protein TolA [Salmonella enterica]ELK5343158.1 cell envelope integrity protein TolA [Salmonella enterica]